MKLSAEIKKHFKSIGIPVRVNTVAVKNPFVQVWIEPEKNPDFRAPLKYNQEFPLAMRQKLLRVIYGEDCQFAEGGNAGNVRSHSMSFHESEWRKTLE